MSSTRATAAPDASAQVLVLPGLHDSGPAHWQSVWEATRPDTSRVRQRDWATPRCEDWMAELDRAVAAAERPVVLVAHSLACALVAHWTRPSSPSRASLWSRVRGALLVAPSDVEAPVYPEGPQGFAPMPLHRLPFAAIVVAGTNDVYVSPERARAFADAWGAELVWQEDGGHLGSDAQLGAWPFGAALLARLVTAPAEPPGRSMP